MRKFDSSATSRRLLMLNSGETYKNSEQRRRRAGVMLFFQTIRGKNGDQRWIYVRDSNRRNLHGSSDSEPTLAAPVHVICNARSLRLFTRYVVAQAWSR